MFFLKVPIWVRMGCMWFPRVKCGLSQKCMVSPWAFASATPDCITVRGLRRRFLPYLWNLKLAGKILLANSSTRTGCQNDMFSRRFPMFERWYWMVATNFVCSPQWAILNDFPTTQSPMTLARHIHVADFQSFIHGLQYPAYIVQNACAYRRVNMIEDKIHVSKSQK